MLDFADIFLKIMYEKIIETTMLKLLIGTTAESRTDCCSKRKADIGEFIFWILFSADGFPFAKISNLAIMSNAYADCCSET